MRGFSRLTRLSSAIAISVLTFALAFHSSANADPATDAQLKALQAQVEALTHTVKELQAAQANTAADAKAAKKQASQADANSVQAKASATEAKAHATKAPVKAASLDAEGHTFLERKPGKALTFYTPGGEITAYGNFDVSVDGATKNAKSGPVAPDGSTPVGNFGWMGDISTNLSYLGVRGFQRIPTQNFNFVYQFEAGIDISAAPGTKQSNSNDSNQVNGALFSRNTFIGLASPEWGAIKVGKSDAPYKNSTAAFNPFSGMWGDYAVIMGNSGGDNRVEFGTRVNHAVWYESPRFLGGFQFNAMFSPGQNRSNDSSNLASGESDCAGGNDPSSGANALVSCSDGAFGNLFSTNLSYTNGPFYATVAYEFHQNVNRQSDLAGAYGVPITVPATGQDCSAFLAAPGAVSGAIAQQQCLEDAANEDAFKVGLMYVFPTKTTVGAIYEHMHRYVSSDLAFQNERSRDGTWLVISQELSPIDSIHFGWAHAFASPGNPGQHNDSTLVTANGAGYGPNENQSDMVTGAWKHRFSENLLWYTNVAATFNGPDAHYDLGAGGRSVTTDCHDANSFSASGGLYANPHCWTGTTLVGISTGLQWKF